MTVCMYALPQISQKINPFVLELLLLFGNTSTWDE